MLTHHPLTGPPVTRPTTRRGCIVDGGLAAVLATTVTVISVPLIIAITGFTLGVASPVVVSVISVLGLYALYQSLDT